MKNKIKATIVTAIIFGLTYLASYTYQNYADAFQYFAFVLLAVGVWVCVYMILKEGE